MSSIIQGYEYDIFISYRQKDNKYDGWVTEFVENLRKELEATFKDEISIYFDINPHDGLLETHNVDASLKEKLKCLVFIPVISQTYCDPRSFAWQNEFIAFNGIAEKDIFGKNIKLSSGNVASRILPVKIHDIERDDISLIENELGSVMRSVDFIFKSPGVNRPLKPDDSRSDNMTHTYYRDQINKLANAVKEIINSLKSPDTGNKKISPVIKDSLSKPGNNSKEKKIAIAFWTLLIVLLVVSGFFLAPILSRNDPPTKNKEAYDMVIQGNFFLKQGPEGGKKALDFFQNAIKLDSGYADAYLGLSRSYFFTGNLIKMKETLDKAHNLNANEGFYHEILLAYYFLHDWNWEAVRSEHEQWLKFNQPGNIGYAWFLATLYGNVNEAIREMDMFLKKDPLNNDGLRNLASFYIMNKQYDAARRTLSKITVTNQSYAFAHERIGYSYYCEGNYEKAIEHFEKSDSLTGLLSSKIEIVIALAHSGHKDQAKKLFEQLISETKSMEQEVYSIGMSPGSGYAATMAMVYFSFEEPDEAFIWLYKAYENREGMMVGLKIEPIYDPFRKDPRFIKIYKKMNFPE